MAEYDGTASPNVPDVALPMDEAPPPHIQIERVEPSVSCGRHAAKRIVGDTVEVSALIFRDGHHALRAVARLLRPGATEWEEVEMEWTDGDTDGDTWSGCFSVDRAGRWLFDVAAWTDAFATWRDEMARKVAGKVADEVADNVAGKVADDVADGRRHLAAELAEGAALLRRALVNAAGDDRPLIEHALAAVEGESGAPAKARLDVIMGEELEAAVRRSSGREDLTPIERPLSIDVDRERARFGAWYELFPRSWGGLAGVEDILPRLADLGFDVVYLTPIHSIGATHRKGRDNALDAGPSDPGSPWAIGSTEGGHEAIDPSIGTMEDFDRLVESARAYGMEVALDFAIQCSPDHPWLGDHPEWFHRRPDGTLKYAENPPKRYQDIYNVNFDSPAWRELWLALYRIVIHWIGHGVRIFRVDNPHTKPTPFWEWLIREVRSRHPGTIFLAEAFTRRAKLENLAKAGFSQSYTYFTWKNTRSELMELVDQLTSGEAPEFLRPNFFTNTPDILSSYLQRGGPAAFAVRLVLAGTLSPSYGIYSGYESLEAEPLDPQGEEYRGSEKYEVKERRLEGDLLPLVAGLNTARRRNPALQHFHNATFLATTDDALIAYLKRTGSNFVITVVNLDPHNAREGTVDVPDGLGLPWTFRVRDELSGETYEWRLGHNYVRLVPAERTSHILVVR